MLYIKCPHCGMRSQNEFSYGGDASIKRPELGKETSNKEWDDLFIIEKVLEENIGSYGNTCQAVDNGSKLREILLLMKFSTLLKRMRIFPHDARL